MTFTKEATHSETLAKYHVKEYQGKFWFIPKSVDLSTVKITDLGNVDKIQAGHYLHYKNKEYTVLAVGNQYPSNEPHVLYQAQYGDKEFWIRPKDMFMETVEVDGKIVPRFKFIKPFMKTWQ